MPVTFRNPNGVHAPGGRYSHAALVTGVDRFLTISGQIGMAPDGTVPADGPAQIAQALENLRTILKAHHMSASSIVKMTVFLTTPTLIPAWREAREAFMYGHAPASTLLIVAGLADPRFLVEVEAEAAA
jgi:2-iminobutanoate/2-iminopropanoate deaminase